MRFSKKSISFVLAVVMLISVFSFAVSAGAPDLSTSETAKVGVSFEYLHEDGTPVTSVKPGETITVNIYATSKIDNDALTKAAFCVFFDSSVYSWIEGSREFIGPKAYISTASNVSVIQAGTTVYNNIAAKMTEEDKAHGWDSALYIQALIDGTVADEYYVKENSDKIFCTAKLKVADDVEPGTKADLGAPQCSIYASKRGACYNYVQTIAATVPNNINLVLGEFNLPLTVASDEPVVTGPVVTKTQAEVKMTLNEDQTAVDYAAAPFQFRVISSISEDDWNTYFNGDGSNIESVGFVAYKGDGAFDMETAKSVAMGGSAADYQAAKTDYIQKVDGQAANFGARIDFTARENVKDVTYIAFVQYDTDQYAFYDTSYSVALNTNYDTIVRDYAGFINA